MGDRNIYEYSVSSGDTEYKAETLIAVFANGQGAVTIRTDGETVPPNWTLLGAVKRTPTGRWFWATIGGFTKKIDLDVAFATIQMFLAVGRRDGAIIPKGMVYRR